MMKAPSDVQLVMEGEGDKRPNFALYISILFALVIYLTPVGWLLKKYVLIFPSIGPTYSYLLTIISSWLVLYLLLSQVLGRFYPGIFPKLPSAMELINRRTGTPGAVDLIGFVLSIAISIFFMITDKFLFPLAFFGVAGFGLLLTKDIKLWLVKAGYREIDPDEVEKPDEDRIVNNMENVVYEWEFTRQPGHMLKGRINLIIDLDEYQEYMQRNPFNNWPNIPDYEKIINELVNKGLTDEVLQATSYFVRTTKTRELTDYEEVSNVLAFVQSLEYDLSKEENRDYWRYPIETLREGKGDCDCFSILAASIYKSLLHKVVILISSKHACLGVSGAEGFPGTFFQLGDKKYYFCETTAKGWRIGEIPAGSNPEDFAAYEV
ncbi:hypothetical protein GF312_20335 [Candidatus Poribacteria bacterium]|nr:hypothetical protein [Candidatus Poribacteria bacterium]